MADKDLEYFDYLLKRGKLSFMLRKLMYAGLARQLRGKVLDVGCGLGEFLELCHGAVGIEPNRYCVDYCKARGLTCKLGNAYEIPYPAGSFDGVLLLHVLEHLTSPEKAASELRRVLRDGGKTVIVVPLAKGYRRDPTHVKFWDATRLRQLLGAHGFMIERISYWPARFFADLTVFGELRVVAIKL